MAVTGYTEAFVASSFGYLIAGECTTGLALAVRLTVGVLEAGAARLNDPSILTPAAFPTLVGKKEHD